MMKILSLLLVLSFGNLLAGQDINADQDSKTIPFEELSKQVASLKKDKVAWRTIDWKTCLIDGLHESKKQNKPILLWVFIDRPIDDERC